MGSNHSHHPVSSQKIHYPIHNCPSLDGIGRPGQFVYQHQNFTSLPDLPDHFIHPQHLSRIRRETVQFILIIPDTGQDLFHERHTRPPGRYIKTELHQVLRQLHTFQQHCLSGHIGSGNHRRSLFQFQIYSLKRSSFLF